MVIYRWHETERIEDRVMSEGRETTLTGCGG